VFYGRYAIHEYWLVFSLMLGAWGFAGLWKEGKRKYLWAIWIGVAGAVLTKETYVVHFAACALTFPTVWGLGVINPMPEAEGVSKQEWTRRDMALGAAMFVACLLFFYSGTFMDMPGLRGLYQCYAAWVHTGHVGNGHEKAWYYWLQLFGRYEWPSCIGLLIAPLCLMPPMPRLAKVIAVICGVLAIGYLGFCLYRDKGHNWQDIWPVLLVIGVWVMAIVCAVVHPPRFIRAIAVYGIGTLVAYSIIHYKTPWCIVSLTWPFLLLFGFGVDLAVRKYGMPVGVVAATALLANCCDMIALNYFHYTDEKEPYVYVQTFKQVYDLMNPLDELVARNPANHRLTGHIMMESYHPLPWLLGDFPNVGYYDEDTNPPKTDADFLMVDESRVDAVESKLHQKYFTETFRLRDAEDESKLYLNAKTFQSVFPGRTPDFVPAKNAPADTLEPDKMDSTPAPADQPSE
jgi:hypothetical protein